MSKFTIYDEVTAPNYARETLHGINQKFGFIPNVMGVTSESQAALETYTSGIEALERSSFSPIEQQILYLAISYENECYYCLAAHSTVAKVFDMRDTMIETLRSGGSLEDPKQRELVNFARLMVRNRGRVSPAEVSAFINAGYTNANVFDVITAVAVKTISNYINHVVETPVDEAFSMNL